MKATPSLVGGGLRLSALSDKQEIIRSGQMIRKINPTRDGAKVEEIIRIYQASFGSEPWYEGWKCPGCEHTMPLIPQPGCCPRCEERMEAYWPREKVLADFKREMERPNARCVVATRWWKVVGFVWGY